MGRRGAIDLKWAWTHRTRIGLALGLVAMASAVSAAVINHDAVQSIPTNASQFDRIYQPYLKVESGCVPFPPVDSAGNVSGGLQNSGAMNGGCSKSSGQVYVRSAVYRDRCGVMYSWYFPKDQNVDGGGNSGHRHDWENIVIWMVCNSSHRILSVAYSSHGEYEKDTTPEMDGTHPKVVYRQYPWPLNHSLTGTPQRGGMQPLVYWGYMSQAARNTLNTHNFGKANVPFNDANFTNNLQKAF